MSLTIIYRKLQELKEKEKKIQDFYDPIKVHKFQHPHIQDLREDYQEDIQNYGFSRFAFKEENEASLDEKDAIKQGSTQQHNRVVSPKGNISQYSSNIKPQSALMRPTTAKKSSGEGGISFQNQLVSPKSGANLIRPTTANKFAADATATVQSEFQMTKTLQSQYLNSMRPQTAFQSNLTNGQPIRNIQSANQFKGYDTLNDRVHIHEQEEHQTQEGQQENLEQNNQGQEVGKKIKHWKFTKKYDTNGKQAVRNQSALKKIVMEGQDGQEEVMDDEELQQIQEKAMENRLNGQKIFITKEGQVLENRENHELNILRKYSPSEREKINFLDTFKSQKQFLSQGEVQFKKIYPKEAEKNHESLHDKRQSTNENIVTDHSQKAINSSIRINTNQSGNKKRTDRPQTAVAFSHTGAENSIKNKNSQQNKTGTQFKKRINSSRPYSATNEQIKIFLEEDQKLFNMKKIKQVVLDKFGPVAFFNKTEQSRLELTEWNFRNLQKDFSFKVVVIDMKTMNFVKFDNLKKINGQLVHTTYKEEQVQINFEKIFTLLGKQHQPTHSMISPQSFFHVLIYQKLSSDEETILFEKFIYKGNIQTSLDLGTQNILFLYYIRYLLCFDPTDIEFKSIYSNSLYILESNDYKIYLFDPPFLKEIQTSSKDFLNCWVIQIETKLIYNNHQIYFFTKIEKRAIPQPLFEYLSLLQNKPIYVEDLSQKTYQFNIFPELQSQLLVEDTQVHASIYQQNRSPSKDWEFSDQKQSAYNYNSNPFNRQTNENENMGNFQIKRPTTAVPYQSQTNQNYQWNSAQIDNNIQQSNTHYNAHSQLQSPLQKQQQQRQLPFYNQQIQYSSSQSQLNTQQILSKHQHNQLPHHLLTNSNLQQNNFINAQLQKPSLPLDYIKNGQQKQGLRPKTAMSKGMRSPSAASLSGLNYGTLTEGQKRHQLNNQMLQLSEQLKSEGKKYEKNVKGFSSPMFIKGSSVKPSFNRDTGIYFLNQH